MYRVSSPSSRGLLFHLGDKSQADILANGRHSQGTRKSALQSGTFLFCLSTNLGTTWHKPFSITTALEERSGSDRERREESSAREGRRAQGRASGLPWFCH